MKGKSGKRKGKGLGNRREEGRGKSREEGEERSVGEEGIFRKEEERREE